jgi:Lrp/AsnC family transcriptional regulator for asnA, asnC and gidA
MFNFYADEMSKLDGVSHSESFMVTNNRRKWALLPPNLQGWV